MASRCVMLVADPGRESISALEWALSHAILENDEVLLLHVCSGSRRGGSSSSFSAFLKRPSLGGNEGSEVRGGGASSGGECEFIETMKTMCWAKQPKVKVVAEKVEMEEKDKAATILAQANRRNVGMIVIGQRRTSFLGSKLSGGITKGSDIAEFLIEHSKCLCVGVQKKQSAGYVLNTKTHKNFWLLA